VCVRVCVGMCVLSVTFGNTVTLFGGTSRC